MKRGAAVWMVLGLLASTVRAWGATPHRQVSIWVARDVAPGPKVGLALNTCNVATLRLATYRLEPTSLLVARAKEPVRPPTPRAPLRTWTVSMARKGEPPPRGERDIYRSRRVNLPPLSPGVYLITAQGDGTEVEVPGWQPWAVVNVTHLAVVVKRSPSKALTWVCHALSGLPLAGARATLYDQDQKPIASGVTRRDGTVVLAAKPGPSQTILVARGRDVAGVPCAVTGSDGVLKAHFQTDRPIYRPGQTVLFKVILRRTQGRGYQALANTACHLEVRDPKDNVLWEKQATSNAVGTISDEFEVPAEGLTGPYTAVVTVGEDSAYETFSVAEYRKPEFKVSAAPAAKRYLAGEEAVFEAQCAYYFGAPVPQAEVRYQVRRDTTPYGTYDELSAWYASSDGNLYPRDTYAASPFVAEGTVYTDDAGKVRIPVKTDKAAPDSVYQITCTVQDPSRRRVQATGSVPVYAASLRLALETDVLVAPLGSVIPLRVKAADLDGKPAAARVTLIEKQPVWIEKEGRYRFKELTRTEVSIPPTGSARDPARRGRRHSSHHGHCAGSDRPHGLGGAVGVGGRALRGGAGRGEGAATPAEAGPQELQASGHRNGLGHHQRRQSPDPDHRGGWGPVAVCGALTQKEAYRLASEDEPGDVTQRLPVCGAVVALPSAVVQHAGAAARPQPETHRRGSIREAGISAG